MAEINLRKARPTGSGPTRLPKATGAGSEQRATAQAITSAQKALLGIEERNGRVAALKLMSDIRAETNGIFNDSVSNSSEDSKNMRVTVNNPEAKNINANGQNFTDHVMSQFDEVVARMDQEVQNPFARSIIREKLVKERDLLEGKASKFEVNLIRDMNLNALGEVADQFSREVEQDPSLFTERNKELMDAIKNANIGGVKTQVGNRFSKHLAMTAAKSFVNTSPDMAHKVLETGKIGVPTFSEDGEILGFTQAKKADFLQHLSGDQVAALKSKALIVSEQKLRSAQSAVNELVKNDAESILETGEGVPGIVDEYKRVFRNNPEKVQEFLNNRETVKKFFGTRQIMKGLPLQALKSFTSTLKPKPGSKTFLKEKALFRMASEEANRQIKLSQTDPVRLVEEDNEEILSRMRKEGATKSEIVQARLDMQSQKGVLSIRTISNAEREGFVNGIMQTDGGQATLDFLSEIQFSFDNVPNTSVKPRGNDVISEIARSDGLSPLYRVVVNNATDRTDPNGRSTAFDVGRAIKESEAINNALTQEDKDKIEENVNDKTDDWFRAFVLNGDKNITRGNELRQAIKQTAGLYFFRDGLSLEEASNKAVKNILDNKLAEDGIISNNIIDGVIVPRTVVDGSKVTQMNASNVEEQLSWLKPSLKRSLFDIKEQPSENFQVSGNTQLLNSLKDKISLNLTLGSTKLERKGGVKSETFMTDEFKRETSIQAFDNLTYKSTADGNGVVLMIRFLHQTLPVLDKEGKPVTFSITDVNMPTTIFGDIDSFGTPEELEFGGD